MRAHRLPLLALTVAALISLPALADRTPSPAAAYLMDAIVALSQGIVESPAPPKA